MTRHPEVAAALVALALMAGAAMLDWTMASLMAWPDDPIWVGNGRGWEKKEQE